AVGALAASVLTVVNNTPGVAALCVLGAFAAPVLIRETTGVPDPSGLLRLYAYLAILNLWVAGMIRVRSWYSLAMVAFLATWLLFFAAGPLQNAGWITEGFALLFLLGSCYLGAQALYTRAKVPTDMIIGTEKVGIGLILGGCLAFVVASMLILASTGVLGLPGATLAGMLVALLLAGLAVALPPLAHQDREVRLLFGNASAAALALVTTAVLLPAQATPPSQVPGAFAFALFHYLLFLAVALFMHSRAGSAGPAAVLVAANALVHVVMAFHVLGTSHIAGVPAAPLWLPLAGWLALAGAWRAVRQQREAVNLPIALLVTALALPFIGLVVTLPQGGDWPALGALFFFGEFLLVSTTTIALRRALSHLPLRTDLLAALGNSAIFFALIARATGLEAFQGLVLLAGAALAMAAYHAWIGGRVLRRSDDDALRRLTYLGLGLTFGTIAIPLQLRASYITLAWAVEAAVLIWTGITVGERRVRWYGTILLAVAAGKALVLDLLMTPEPFRLLLNTRMLAGAAVIAAAYVAAWLLWRRRVVLAPEERLIPAALTVVANVFTLLFVSLDLWQYLGQIWPRAGRGSAQQLGLSLFWTVYALAAVSVGIWQRTRLVRLFAVGLLYLSIVKVFVFDLSGLEQPYRIVSFFALGVTLLLVSLLYTRFEGRLSEQPAAPTRSPPPTLLLAIALAALSAQAQEDWRTVRPIALPELAAPQLVYLPLDEPALAGVVTLAEYRIIQQDGSVVPYRVMVERGQTESYVLDTRVVSQSPPGSNPVEITLDLGARPASPLNLFLDLEGSNFESRVQIDGSHDQRQWQPIGEGGRVFRQVDGAPQTEIVLPEQDYQFLQVRLFPLQGSLPTVRRVLVSIKLTIPRHLLPVTATLEQREATVETVLELDPGQRVRDLVEARFEIAEPAFDRPVSVEALWDDEGTFLGTHRLRRLAPGGEISLPLEVSQARRVRFTIRNGDDPPLAILGVTLWRVRRGLVFSAAPGQQYQLWYGRPDAPAPEYELERLPLTTPPAALPLAALGPEQALPPPPAPPPPA
ncbi:MAG: DUF2339 domain-containing protein, partial [Deinococcus sp.]|nr:DUF2339 domain-containing protein [Deinococcus sp.]